MNALYRFTGLMIALALPLLCAQPALAGPPYDEPCQGLQLQSAQALAQHDYTLAAALDKRYAEQNCGMPIKIPPVRPACSAGIKNIATFLQTCPTADPAYAQIEQDFPISYDGAVVPGATLKSDINAVCSAIGGAAQQPSLKQQAEHTAAQVLRTMYYMDNHGVTGCSYPWTNGAGLYPWMKSLVSGVDERDDTQYSDCCEPGTATKVHIAFTRPAASQYPGDYTAMGILSQMALFVHETRHAPGNTGQPVTGISYAHSTCCPEQSPGKPNSCDDTYHEGIDMAPYAMQYWLFRAWVKGNINVGYSCADPTDVSNLTQFLAGGADGYIGRFCTAPPAQIPWPVNNPGGTCPP
jgi:hypothetical protein